MSAQFQIEDPMWGTLSIFVIRMSEDGSWEDDWEPFRVGAPPEIVDLVSPVSYEAYFELKHRHTRPFLAEVGLDPKGCLTKLAEGISMCHYRTSCPSYDPKLCGGHLDPPPCYDASVSDDAARRLATRLVDLWRMGFYVIVVEPDDL